MHVVVASHHRLPVEGYGGPQRVVVALVRGLAALGHRVTLLAQPGTKVPEAAKIVEVAPRILKDSGVDLKKFIPDGAEILHAHFPLKQVSRDHARRHGSSIFVHNGLDPAEYIFRGRKERWDLFLGKLHSDRGYHWAVEAAKRAGRQLIIAGGWRPTFTGTVKYVGEVDGKRKAVLLARARCLWMPAQWDEPFGLPTIEALFSGTAVIGTRRGALPEIVTPAVGVLRDTLDELILAADKVTTLDPRACRERAERQFSHLVMAENYVRMYQHVQQTGDLPASVK